MKKLLFFFVLLLASGMAMAKSSQVKKQPFESDRIVRLSYIEIHPEYHDQYMAMALEIYASQDAYKKHIASEHFQKYKQGTLHMVKHLDLIDTDPLNPLMSISSEIADK